EVDGHVRLCPGVWLHIGAIGPEQLEEAFDGQALGLVDELAAAVITFARQALGIFIRQHRPLGLQYSPARVVLRGDHLEPILLAARLVLDGLPDFRVDVFQWVHQLPHFLGKGWFHYRLVFMATMSNRSDFRRNGSSAKDPNPFKSVNPAA